MKEKMIIRMINTRINNLRKKENFSLSDRQFVCCQAELQLLKEQIRKYHQSRVKEDNNTR